MPPYAEVNSPPQRQTAPLPPRLYLYGVHGEWLGAAEELHRGGSNKALRILDIVFRGEREGVK